MVQNISWWASRITFLAAFSILTISHSAQAQIFGKKPSFGNFLNNKALDVVRKLPPVYDLHGKRIVVTVGGDVQAGHTNIEVQSEIEKLLTSFDSTVHVETVRPDITINCKISHYSAPALVQVQSEDTLVRVGSGVHTTTMIEGGLNITFRITEARTGHVIAASMATAQVAEPAPTGSILAGLPVPKKPKDPSKPKDPNKIDTTFDAQNMMVRETSRQIASYLAITPETVHIQLAVGGPLTEPNKLAQNFLWSRYLEALSTVPPLADPMLDSYRLYDIGVANEALAYQAKDPVSSQRYLQEASIDYGKAVESNPKEKNFLPPQNRITSALEHYAANKTVIAQARAENRGAGFLASGPAASGSGKSASASASKAALTNDDIIRMVKAGVDEEGVTDAIKTAKTVNFDLSPDGLINLSTNGVSGKIQSLMRLRVRGSGASGKKG